jgi:hypothetical protein
MIEPTGKKSEHVRTDNIESRQPVAIIKIISIVVGIIVMLSNSSYGKLPELLKKRHTNPS